jgi:hypothetical protein
MGAQAGGVCDPWGTRTPEVTHDGAVAALAASVPVGNLIVEERPEDLRGEGVVLDLLTFGRREEDRHAVVPRTGLRDGGVALLGHGCFEHADEDDLEMEGSCHVAARGGEEGRARGGSHGVVRRRRDRGGGRTEEVASHGV